MLADLVDLRRCWGAASGRRPPPRVRKRASSRGAGVAAGQDHLEGDEAVEADLPGLVDDAHAAAAELAEDLVARQHRAA